jgi:hypothetical protein
VDPTASDDAIKAWVLKRMSAKPACLLEPLYFTQYDEEEGVEVRFPSCTL